MFNKHNIIGSEYLGLDYTSGCIINGIRHENIENLSLQSNEFDLIISNDVFEHIPNPKKAFSECARILKNNGLMLATIPFHCTSNVSINRAKLIGKQIVHYLPKVFHGNPISSEGSLVFTDFGWDIIQSIKLFFSDVVIEIYLSVDLGHVGLGQLVFRAIK